MTLLSLGTTTWLVLGTVLAGTLSSPTSTKAQTVVRKGTRLKHRKAGSQTKTVSPSGDDDAQLDLAVVSPVMGVHIIVDKFSPA